MKRRLDGPSKARHHEDLQGPMWALIDELVQMQRVTHGWLASIEIHNQYTADLLEGIASLNFDATMLLSAIESGYEPTDTELDFLRVEYMQIEEAIDKPEVLKRSASDESTEHDLSKPKLAKLIDSVEEDMQIEQSLQAAMDEEDEGWASPAPARPRHSSWAATISSRGLHEGFFSRLLVCLFDGVLVTLPQLRQYLSHCRYVHRTET